MAQQSAQSAIPAGTGKAPRTARGEKTMRKILDAALAEFGEKGFSDSSIVSITGRAKVALGTFYTYFDSKEALFAALVRDMSTRVKNLVPPAISEARDAMDAEERTLRAYLEFVAAHKEVYRIIDEAEFVDPDGFRAHYEAAASRTRPAWRLALKAANCGQPATSRMKSTAGPIWDERFPGPSLRRVDQGGSRGNRRHRQPPAPAGPSPWSRNAPARRAAISLSW
jgi:AcrR family transcriptional regulator